MLLRLPLDVIHYVIRDMLDYESKVCMNQVLLPRDRFCSRFQSKECIRHQTKVSSAALKSVLDRCSSVLWYDPMYRVKTVRTLLARATSAPHIILITLYHEFRAEVWQKADDVLVARAHKPAWLMRLTRNVRKRLYRTARRAIRVCTDISPSAPATPRT